MTRLQVRVDRWVRICLGDAMRNSIRERCFRFLEESLELVQACGLPKDSVLKLVDYVYARPVGDPPQEVGGVSITLFALCNTVAIDQEAETEHELDRCWKQCDQIHDKAHAKPLELRGA